MRNKLPKKTAAPDFVGKTFECHRCGGGFVIEGKTSVFVPVGSERVHTTCPYCGSRVCLDFDPHANYRKKLTTFILSQVEPIKAINDENIRLPMERLLDDFNRLVQED